MDSVAQRLCALPRTAPRATPGLALLALVAAASAACTPSLREMEDHNRRAHAEIEATRRAVGPAFEPQRVEVEAARVVAGEGRHGLERGEAIYADEHGQLVLLAGACAVQARCGDDCARMVDYTYHHAPDGRVVVVRSRVHLDVVRTRDNPDCPADCGGGARILPQPMPARFTAQGLGVTSIDQVVLRTVAYTEQIVDVRCTNTQPVP